MVSEIYSVGPLIAGSGINITVWSYVDQLNISVLTDGITLDGPRSYMPSPKYVPLRDFPATSPRC